MRPWKALLLATGLVLAVAAPVQAHSYADPALRTVLDGVQPTPLPAGVSVAVVPSVVDEVVVTNPTTTVLELKAVGGEPFLRVSSTGVEANLASPDWYSTGTPEGGVPAPADVTRDKGKGTPRWARVSQGSTWAEFDSRLHPPVAATPAMRKAGKDTVLATWRIPLRYGTTQLAATGHVLFSPVRGGLTTEVTGTPTGITATALQGELPGLFVQVDAPHTLVVQGSDGQPFLRFAGGTVSANTASVSWAEDQRAKGHDAPASGPVPHWTRVGNGSSYSWLEPRLRYPSDQPPDDELGRTTIVKRWSLPATADGTATALAGTVTWVPRSVALGEVAPAPRERHTRWWPWALGAGLVVVIGVLGATWRRRPPRGGPAH